MFGYMRDGREILYYKSVFEEGMRGGKEGESNIDTEQERK